MSKTPSLSVHKNTLENRKRKELRDKLIDDARGMAKNSACSDNINGYAILVWDDDHRAQTCWHSGALPADLIGEHFRQTMAREITRLDIKRIMGDK